MIRAIATLCLTLPLLACGTMGAEDPIENAMSAGPESLSRNATIMDWDGNVLRQGTNTWTCLPDIPNNGANDPWCVDEAWLNLLDAMRNKTKPTHTTLGVGYMLMGDAPVSNTDPSATEKTNDADWVEGLGAHLMILVPDPNMLKGVSTDPNNGGPWIMWPGTPYEHLMVPIDSYPE